MVNKMINRDIPYDENIVYIVGNNNLTKNTGANSFDGTIEKFSPPLCPLSKTSYWKR